MDNDHNFLTQAKPTDIRTLGSSEVYKEVTLHIFSLVGAVAFGGTYWLYTIGHIGIGWVFVSFLVFAVCSALEVLLITNIFRRVLIIIGECVALLPLFILHDRSPLILGLTFAIVLVFSLFGEFRARHELKNTLEQRFVKIARSKIGPLTTGLAFMVVLLYMPNLKVQNIQFEKILVTPTNFHAIINFGTSLLKDFSNPDYDLSGTIADFAKNFAKSKIEPTTQYQDASETERAELVSSAADGIIAQFSKEFGSAVNATEPAENVFYNLIIQTLNGWRDRYGDWFLAAWILLFFFLMKSLGFIFSLIASGLTYLVVQLMIVLGATEIVTETRSKETLSF